MYCRCKHTSHVEGSITFYLPQGAFYFKHPESTSNLKYPHDIHNSFVWQPRHSQQILTAINWITIRFSIHRLGGVTTWDMFFSCCTNWTLWYIQIFSVLKYCNCYMLRLNAVSPRPQRRASHYVIHGSRLGWRRSFRWPMVLHLVQNLP